MVSLTAVLILLAFIVPLPTRTPDQEADTLARRLDEWVPEDSKYWGHD